MSRHWLQTRDSASECGPQFPGHTDIDARLLIPISGRLPQCNQQDAQRMERGYGRRHKKCAPNNESDVSKTTAKTEVFRHLEPGDIVEISGNTRPVIGTFPHTTLRKAHGSHCAGNHIKVDEKRRYHISNLSQVVKPSYDRPRPNLQGQRHHLQAYRTRETNANR